MPGLRQCVADVVLSVDADYRGAGLAAASPEATLALCRANRREHFLKINVVGALASALL